MLRRVTGVRGQGSGASKIAGTLVLLAVSLHAAIFPDQIGDFKKGAPKTVAVADQELYNEYGFETTEQAEYHAEGKQFTATAWRMHDSTGAMALFEARRPPGATPDTMTPLSVRTSDGVIFAYGNYLFQFTGSFPPAADLEAVYAQLPKLEQSPLPALRTFLPAENLVPNSERYLLGPVSLARFEPRISPSVAAFHLGSEAQLGKYKTAKGSLTLAIFDYPTPAIARERYGEFQKVPGAVSRRVGDLVAVTVAPPDPDAAERVLSQVKYETNITWNEKVPENPTRSLLKLILDILIFSGVVAGLCVVAGLGFGGFRILLRKRRGGEDPESLVTLRLYDK